VTDQQAPASIDLNAFAARIKMAAATVRSAAHSIESEWGWGNAYDVYEAARLLGSDVYVGDQDGPDVPALVAELRAAREVVEATRRFRRTDTDWRDVAATLAAYDRAMEGGGK
jgi:hypothetical protein